ncbi:MAG: hypothetical protein ACJA0V_003740 [Planctomycetota bacterium]|jgi:hypothetical protein
MAHKLIWFGTRRSIKTSTEVPRTNPKVYDPDDSIRATQLGRPINESVHRRDRQTWHNNNVITNLKRLLYSKKKAHGSG